MFFSVHSVEMVAPEVDQKLLEELEGMGFPKARATRALHYSGKAIDSNLIISPLMCRDSHFGCG